MRERITLIHPQDTGVEPEALKIGDASLEAPDIKAVREDRLTLAVDELPSEIAQVLQDLQELQIRWTSPLAYDTVEPFASRLSPGLYVSYTHSKGSSYEPYVRERWRLCLDFVDHVSGRNYAPSYKYSAL